LNCRSKQQQLVRIHQTLHQLSQVKANVVKIIVKVILIFLVISIVTARGNGFLMELGQNRLDEKNQACSKNKKRQAAQQRRWNEFHEIIIIPKRFITLTHTLTMTHLAALVADTQTWRPRQRTPSLVPTQFASAPDAARDSASILAPTTTRRQTVGEQSARTENRPVAKQPVHLSTLDLINTNSKFKIQIADRG
jgi:hypothetical protein